MKNLEKLSQLLAGLDDTFHAQVDAAAQTEPSSRSVRRRAPLPDPFQMDWAWATPTVGEQAADQDAVRTDAKRSRIPGVRWQAHWPRSWQTVYGTAATVAAAVFLMLWVGSRRMEVAGDGREELSAAVASSGDAANKTYHVTCPRAGFVTVIPYRLGEGREQVAVEPRITDKLKQVKAAQAWKYVPPKREAGVDSLVFVMTETPADSIVQRIVQQRMEGSSMPSPEAMRELIREELWKSGYTWVAFGLSQG